MKKDAARGFVRNRKDTQPPWNIFKLVAGNAILLYYLLSFPLSLLNQELLCYTQSPLPQEMLFAKKG